MWETRTFSLGKIVTVPDETGRPVVVIIYKPVTVKLRVSMPDMHLDGMGDD